MTKLDERMVVRYRREPLPGWYVFETATGKERAGPFDTRAKALTTRRKLLEGGKPFLRASWTRRDKPAALRQRSPPAGAGPLSAGAAAKVFEQLEGALAAAARGNGRGAAKAFRGLCRLESAGRSGGERCCALCHAVRKTIGGQRTVSHRPKCRLGQVLAVYRSLLEARMAKYLKE